MKLLIVEDRPDSIDTLREALSDLNAICTYVTSRNSAIEAIVHEEFDLALLDLKIPAEDKALLADVSHGKAVYQEFRNRFPGSPVIFQTAYGTHDFISDRLNEAEPHDGWGSRENFPMVSLLSKDRLPDLVSLIKNLCRVFDETEQLELSGGAHGIVLKDLEKRVLRIFCRRREGVCVELAELTGGLSDARVFGARVISRDGETIIYAAAKIAAIDKTRDEYKRYNSEVVRLPLGTFPQLVDQVFFGAGGYGGLFYRLAEEYNRSFFDLLSEGTDRAAQAVVKLRRAEAVWQDRGKEDFKTILDLRRLIVTDEEFEPIRERLGVDRIKSIESMKIHMKSCCQHCDMHGSNILVNDSDTPILIDFQQVGRCSSVFDPVTLELSVLFHPDAASLRTGWATPDVVRRWHELEWYQAATPFGSFVRACRDWMFSSGRDRAVYSTVYAYAAKQLRYDDTDHDLAIALIDSALKGLAAT